METRHTPIPPLKCLVVDDEQRPIDLLCHYISQRAELSLVNTTTDPRKVPAMVEEYGVTLLFADLQMAGLHGIDLIRLLDSKVQVICCTAYDHYGPQLYELEVAYYLQKPIAQQAFDRAVDRALTLRGYRHWREGHFSPLDVNEECSLRLPGKKKWISLKLVDIEYVEAKEKIAQVCYTDGKELVDYPIGQLERLLPAAHFVRVHKSFIVSKNRIKKYNVDSGITLRGTADKPPVVPVGRTYHHQVQELMAQRELERLKHEKANH
ncbi:LytR/AlgR family response regulator transcription factor [Olivibacter sitiensis]|uniref:LytR/AlgR family response regulator transcription factor n=1 Tax=Olivibacter sitiensis TaxID=376470 RepID=UPI000480A9B7|nr:LytTR family DNA-binding domain-containing protein [Olivibacter sitiensis]